MIEVRKSLLVPYSAERMFDLIERAEDYPAFLPWCSNATILERHDEVVAAAITVDYHGVKFHFTTRNPKRHPDWLAIRLESGPFRRFEGEWHLAPLGDEGCRIRFDLHYEFASTLMRTLAGPVFGRIADTLVDAFVSRAEQVYVAAPVPSLSAGPTTARTGRPAPLAPTYGPPPVTATPEPREPAVAIPVGAVPVTLPSAGAATAPFATAAPAAAAVAAAPSASTEPASIAPAATSPAPSSVAAAAHDVPPTTPPGAPAAPDRETNPPLPEGAMPHG